MDDGLARRRASDKPRVAMAAIHERLANLAVPERTRLLRLLELEELAVGEIARVVQMPQSTVSRHLKALEEDGWVLARRDGTARLFAVRDDLDAAARDLWALVRAATDGEHPEDGLRLASVLAARDVDPRRFFGQIAGQWSELRHELFGHGYLLPTLLSLLPREMEVIDLGCGTGDVVSLLAPVVRRVVGVDREPAMLAEAGRRLGGLVGVELVEAQLDDLPFPRGTFDVALFMHVLHHMELPSLALREAARVLRPSGRVVVLDMVPHDHHDWRRTMGHVHLGFSAEDLAAHGRVAGLELRQYRLLPPDPEATGPALFLGLLEPAGVSG